jgi:hypothetical protein
VSQKTCGELPKTETLFSTDVRSRVTEWNCRAQVTSAVVLVPWGPVEECQEWALVRRDKAVLPAATRVEVAVEEWLGREPEVQVVLNFERR